MSMLTIRNLSEATHARLKQRAAARGHSMEAEARAILDESVARPEEPFDAIAGLRQISQAVQLTDEEIALLTPDRSTAAPRHVDFGSDQ